MNGDQTTNKDDPPEKGTRPRSGKSNDPMIGAVLDGRFQIEGILGQGGMSIVYKAHQLRVNRPVAIKTLKVLMDSQVVYRERFQREINSLCRLNHPNIVTIYDCVIGEDDQPYIIMDYLSGKSLERLILDEGPLNLDRFSRIFVQVCSALDHAHRKGIVHRDLKPGNIVLMDDEMDFVKVVDFGLARLGQDSISLTQSGELWGSPPYMSPEQCMGESGDERSDIYALGTVMYELVTGKPAFSGKSVYELIQKHVHTYPAPLKEINPALEKTDLLEEVIFKALHKDPAERYASAQELQDNIIRACAPILPRGVSEYLVHIAQQARMRPQASNIRMDAISELAVLESAQTQSAVPTQREILSQTAQNVSSHWKKNRAKDSTASLRGAFNRDSGENMDAQANTMSLAATQTVVVDARLHKLLIAALLLCVTTFVVSLSIVVPMLMANSKQQVSTTQPASNMEEDEVAVTPENKSNSSAKAGSNSQDAETDEEDSSLESSDESELDSAAEPESQSAPETNAVSKSREATQITKSKSTQNSSPANQTPKELTRRIRSSPSRKD